jgi:hypothetical protein
MRKILEKVRKSDYDEVKAGAESRAQAEQVFRRFRARWRREYGGDAAPLGTRLAGTAVVLRFSPAPVAEAAHHS